MDWIKEREWNSVRPMTEVSVCDGSNQKEWRTGVEGYNNGLTHARQVGEASKTFRYKI